MNPKNGQGSVIKGNKHSMLNARDRRKDVNIRVAPGATTK